MLGLNIGRDVGRTWRFASWDEWFVAVDWTDRQVRVALPELMQRRAFADVDPLSFAPPEVDVCWPVLIKSMSARAIVYVDKTTESELQKHIELLNALIRWADVVRLRGVE